jgi:hypothetical protein
MTAARRTRARAAASTVTIRSMSSPRPGWTLAAAVRLVREGYRLEQVERLTGYAVAHVRAQLTPAERDSCAC